MDWRLFVTVFVTIFLAELGDKTQLATFVFAAKSENFWIVFVGAAFALIMATLAGAFLGVYIGKWIPHHFIRIGGGVLFILMGILILLKR